MANPSTAEGPAFKPLPVVVCVLLAPFGSGAAPVLWVLFARAAAFGAVVLAFAAGRRLAGGSVAAGMVAGAGAASISGYSTLAANGMTEGLLVALILAGVEAWRRGRFGWALACWTGAALLRVEAWPFLLLAAVVHVRRRPADRVPLIAAGVVVLAAWFVPEWLGSGDPLRSGDRARIPNPGQPAQADVPFLAALGEGLGVAPVVAMLGLLTLVVRRPCSELRWLVGAGAAWLLLVAAMAQAGFSGEARYALPGAALLAVGGTAAAVRSAGQHRTTVAAAFAVVLLPSLLATAKDVQGLQQERALRADGLRRAVALAGGRDAVLACGTVYTVRFRGPQLAYHLDIARRDVEPDAPPRPPGVVFADGTSPGAAGFALVGRTGGWTIRRAVLGHPNRVPGRHGRTRSAHPARPRHRRVRRRPLSPAAGDARAASESGRAESFGLQRLATGFNRPVWAGVRPGRSDLVVAEQPGRLVQVTREGRRTILDLRDQVTVGAEQGLLGVAFHPDFAGGRPSRLRPLLRPRRRHARGRVPHGRRRREADAPAPARRQPEENHNGGHVAFGPDGRLYLGLGDGGGAFDPDERPGPATKLGKLIATDVDAERPRWETVLVGLRNPWRFSFDFALKRAVDR